MTLDGQGTWQDWKADILTFLEYHQATGVLDKTIVKPEEPPENAAAAAQQAYKTQLLNFSKANAVAKLAFRSTITPEVRALIRMCNDDALEIWQELKKHFEKKNDVRFSKVCQSFFKSKVENSETITLFVAGNCAPYGPSYNVRCKVILIQNSLSAC